MAASLTTDENISAEAVGPGFSIGLGAARSMLGSGGPDLSGKIGSLEAAGGASEVAAKSFCVPTFPWTRKMLSEIFRARKSTIAGCQSGWALRNPSSNLPADRNLAKEAWN